MKEVNHFYGNSLKLVMMMIRA